MIKVALHGAEFFAFHGFYAEEQKLGTRFIVDIAVGFESDGNITEDKLANTVNYEQLYQITNDQMKQTRKLIETVAQAILDEIKNTWPALENIEVSIKKLHPPLGCRIDYSSVTINYTKA